jgi:hypothetical protein
MPPHSLRLQVVTPEGEPQTEDRAVLQQPRQVCRISRAQILRAALSVRRPVPTFVWLKFLARPLLAERT